MGNTLRLFNVASSQGTSPESTSSDGDRRYHKRDYEELAELLTNAKQALAEAEKELYLGWAGKKLGNAPEPEVKKAMEMVEIAREKLRVVTGEVEMELSEWEKSMSRFESLCTAKIRVSKWYNNRC
jgi:hypothetical protein